MDLSHDSRREPDRGDGAIGKPFGVEHEQVGAATLLHACGNAHEVACGYRRPLALWRETGFRERRARRRLEDLAGACLMIEARVAVTAAQRRRANLLARQESESVRHGEISIVDPRQR